MGIYAIRGDRVCTFVRKCVCLCVFGQEVDKRFRRNIAHIYTYALHYNMRCVCCAGSGCWTWAWTVVREPATCYYKQDGVLCMLSIRKAPSYHPECPIPFAPSPPPLSFSLSICMSLCAVHTSYRNGGYIIVLVALHKIMLGSRASMAAHASACHIHTHTKCLHLIRWLALHMCACVWPMTRGTYLPQTVNHDSGHGRCFFHLPYVPCPLRSF